MSAVVVPLLRPAPAAAQVGFDRSELQLVLDLYGRMVAAGHWRDYALRFERDCAAFAAFRRASERPEAVLWKRPALRMKQGLYLLVGEAGQPLKRGSDLRAVLSPLERRLLKLVEARP